MSAYNEIITKHQPALLQVTDWQILSAAVKRTNFLLYGEIHGIKENADVVYTLVRNLGFKRIAVENDPAIKSFIDTAVNGFFDFSLIDSDTFDTSILSIEMAKTIITLMKEGYVDEVVYIDTYFSNISDDWIDNESGSPQKREDDLASAILALEPSTPTICLLGQWHTQPQIVTLRNDEGQAIGEHMSALYRCRLIKPHMAFVHVIYKQGQLYNDERTINLPVRDELPERYVVREISDDNFELSVPLARKISLPEVKL